MTDRVVTVPDSLEIPAAVKVPSARLSDSTAAGRALLDAADAAAQRAALGLGTAATTPATDYATAAQGAKADAGDVAQITLTGDLALTIPEGHPAGQVYRCAITQDGVGGHTVTYNDQPVTVDTTAGAVTTVELYSAGAGYVVRYPVADLDAQVSALAEDGGSALGASLSSTYVAQFVVDDTPAAPAEGTSATYFVTSAVSWPVGLEWSTDPDGGVAPTITGTALVSLFTYGGVTRAVLGATFPALPAAPDTTAPTAGTLSVVMGSTTADLTVAGATDETALAALPYAYSLNGGAYTAYQDAATYQFDSLTPETSYTFRHRVIDAAGNITEGTAVTDSTTAVPADSTPPTAGTLASSAITETTATLTVSGAADETTLHAQPYRFSTDNGATYTAYQASNVYAATGLTASTAYTCKHQTRDAAGNVSTGTAITVTTSAASALSGAILPLNPVGYWKLDETSGTAALDYSGNGRDGVYKGTYTLGVDGFASFAAGGYVSVPDNDAWSLAGSTGLSIFALSKPTTAPSTVWQHFVSKGTAPGSAEWNFSLIKDARKLEMNVSDAAATVVGVKSESSLNVVVQAQWNAVAAALPAYVAKVSYPVLYHNSGTPCASVDSGTGGVVITNGTGPLQIAARWGSASLIGQMAHVAVFSGQLSDEQVAGLMAAAASEGFIA